VISLSPQIWEYYLLALCVYRESRGEGYLAQAGVAFVVLNRVKVQGWWGKTISEVIGWPYQFSSMGSPGDRQLMNWPAIADLSWKRTLEVVEDVLNGAPDPTRGATHFYDDSIAQPEWAKTGEFKVRLGRLNFYKAA
jgi:spore germination cell wall hydrolase CwlJ-like protein